MRLSLLFALLVGSLTAMPVQSAELLYPAIPAEAKPQLSSSGQYAVGVGTLQITQPQRLDLNTQQPQAQSITLEIWYPTTAAAHSHHPFAQYANVTKSGQPFQIQGNALRDAPTLTQRYPLVVLSHGYTGYRTLMYYLGEHLASHGYVVVALDHPQSTNAEIDARNAPFSGFLNTLYHRARDQQWLLSYLRNNTTRWSNNINTDQAAVIGYSMGGYGAINTVGGCFHFSQEAVMAFTGDASLAANQPLLQALNSCAAGQYQNAKPDPAWKAAIAIAPWGGQHRLFDAESLQQIRVPMLYLAGDQDDVSGYEGMQWLYQQTGSPAKYLLTYHHARHNIAPHPAPAIARNNLMDFAHYHEPTWSTQHINYINQHFMLAMLDCHLKDKAEQCAYLALPETPAAAVQKEPQHSGWLGFPKRYATGLSWQYQRQN